MIKKLAALLLFSFASLAEASDYPPGYAVESRCQTKGPVRVCAINRNYGSYPRLHIQYKGYLGTRQPLSAWISFNGRSNVYPFPTPRDTLTLNEPVPYRCWVGGLPDGQVGPYGPCARPHSQPVGSLVWEIVPIAAKERDLFYYARNEWGRANAWDIELAFVDQNGRWDSIYGENYVFRFESNEQ